MGMTPIAMTIAGSDSGGGAGIQADLKTFSALGVYGASAITAITAQNTQGVSGVHDVPPEMVHDQIKAVLDDLDVSAIKIGMLSQAVTIEAVARALDHYEGPVVLDPVMVATSGDPLINDNAMHALQTLLVPRASLITPNLPEAARLLGTQQATTLQQAAEQGEALRARGAHAVLVKGGHGVKFAGTDILIAEGLEAVIPGDWVATRNTHGTGCTLSSAIAAHFAKGAGLEDAVRQGKAYLQSALEHADTLHIGEGAGPVHHFHSYW